MKKKATSFVPVVMAGFKPSAADAELLREVLALDKLSDANREAFEDMLVQVEDGYSLSAKQKKWALGLLDKPTYENLISSGKAPRGREVPEPEVLKRRPLKPPGRK